jgi:hypothetical protein
MQDISEALPYKVRPLSDSDIPRAFVLVQSLLPDVDYAAWVAHVEEVCEQDAPDAPSGLRVLAGPHDYLYGLFSYRALRTLSRGRVLQLDDFCVAPLTSRRTAAGALLAEGDRLAHRHGCRALAVTFLGAEHWTAEEGPDAAFGLDGVFVPAPPAVMKNLS